MTTKTVFKSNCWSHCLEFTSNQFKTERFLFATLNPNSFCSLNPPISQLSRSQHQCQDLWKQTAVPPLFFFITCCRLSPALINSDWTEQSEEVQFRVKLSEIAWNCALLKIEDLIFVPRVVKQDHLIFQPLLFCNS